MKRVVGVPGDVLELREQVLYVNGVPQPRTHAGELAYEERSDATGALFADTCRRYREALARGELAAPTARAPRTPRRAGRRPRPLGSPTYDVLQCRRARLASREGPFEVSAPATCSCSATTATARPTAAARAAGRCRSITSRAGHARVLELGGGRGGRRRPRGPRLERLFKRIE